MIVGHIYLATSSDDASEQFATLVEALDRLAVEQTVLVANGKLARRLQCCPYVVVGPIVKSPITAFCLMSDVDIVHIHDVNSGQAGLLMTLTRSTPFVMTTADTCSASRNPLKRSVFQRAQSLIPPSDIQAEGLIQTYNRIVDEWEKLRQDRECG